MLPDYRGLFLRGYGSQNFAQANGTKNGVTTTAYSSGAVGIVQGDAAREVTASTWSSKKTEDLNFQGFITDSEIAHIGEGAFSFFGTYHHANLPERTGGTNAKGFMSLGLDFKSGRTVPVANENRPVNVAVRYLIRARE